jgi:hypothetical protein
MEAACRPLLKPPSRHNVFVAKKDTIDFEDRYLLLSTSDRVVDTCYHNCVLSRHDDDDDQDRFSCRLDSRCAELVVVVLEQPDSCHRLSAKCSRAILLILAFIIVIVVSSLCLRSRWFHAGKLQSLQGKGSGEEKEGPWSTWPQGIPMYVCSQAQHDLGCI